MSKSRIASLIFFLAPVLDSLSAGCGTKGTEKLTAFVGENLSLPTGSSELHGNFFVIWYKKNDTENRSIVIFEPENQTYSGSNLRVDNRTGALTLGPLGINDSSVYVGEITNGNNGVCRFTYEVSVSEPVTKSPAVGIQSNITAQPRNHTAVAVSVCLVAVVGVVGVVVTACVLLVKRRNGKSQAGAI